MGRHGSGLTFGKSGLQTLICIYKRPDLMFNATSCGENCVKWLLEIGKRYEAGKKS